MLKKRLLKIVIIAFVSFIVIIILGFNIFGNRLIKDGIEIFASEAMGVKVAVADVDLRLMGGKASIKELSIDNPEGYQHDKMIEMGLASVQLNSSSLFTDTIEIEDITLKDFKMVMEQKGLTSNLQEIIKRLQSEEEQEKAHGGKNLVIKRLEISGVEVNIKLLPIPGEADTMKITVAPIVMENLGSDNKMDMAVLTGTIMVAVAKGIANQGQGILPDQLIGPMGDILGGVGEGAGKALKDTTKIGTDILKDATDSIGKGLKIFDKDK